LISDEIPVSLCNEYGAPTITAPKCKNGTIDEIKVNSNPPCWVAVDVKNETGLPVKAPDYHNYPHESMKVLVYAAITPNLVGVPRIIASYFGRSSALTTSISAHYLAASKAYIFSSTSFGKVSAILLISTSAPAFLAPSA